MDDQKIKLVINSLVDVIQDILPEVQLPDVIKTEDTELIKATKNFLAGTSLTVNDDLLKSVFNSLNGNMGNLSYEMKPIDIEGIINFPSDKTEGDVTAYKKEATELINKMLSEVEVSDKWLNSFLEILEINLSFVPGTLSDRQISLFDQAKFTASVALNMAIAGDSKESVSEGDELFLLYSMDFSGIQDFIYTINSKGALKMLRARSFYLEILMENVIDDLLSELGLSRIDLIYSGGGHCYMFLPNTEEIIKKLDDYNLKVYDWLIDKFDISLFIGHGYSPCSINSLKNIPDGSYSEIFRRTSRMISDHKANRYKAEQIIAINNRDHDDYTRECKVCKRLDKLNSENECSICSAIKDFSKHIQKDDYFVVSKDQSQGLPLPGGYSMEGHERLPDNEFVRAYRKKAVSDTTGRTIGIWVGDYTSDKTLEEMAQDAKDRGMIDRIGVYRADVDNLGSSISFGFSGSPGGPNILKTATLSRQLTLFFKHYINHILSNPSYSTDGTVTKGRNATICYAGGDDLSIVGEWFDVVELAIDLRNDFQKYSQSSLSISGGIGIYDHKYPISRTAYETAELEDMSKKNPGKDSITLLCDGEYHYCEDPDGRTIKLSDGTYKWEEFIDEVIGSKMRILMDFFDNSPSRGMNFMYNLLDLVRNQSERINFARFVYTLSRLEPGRSAPPEEKQQYKVFADNMSQWIKNDKDRRQLKTAMTLYAYISRNREDK